MKNHLNDLPTIEEKYGDDQYRTNLQSIRSQLTRTVSDAAKRFKNPRVVLTDWGHEIHISITEGVAP